MDIYLISKCQFVISSGTGIDALGEVFRKPTFYVNLCQFGTMNITSERINYYPKKYIDKLTEKEITLDQIFKKKIPLLTLTEQFAELNILPISYSGNELLELSNEIFMRYLNKWNDTENDKQIRKIFESKWSMLGANVPRPQIFTTYLRKYFH